MQAFSARWFPLPEKALTHPAQLAWEQTDKRFNLVPAGRRAYKTERAKRKLIMGTPYGEAILPGALTLPGGVFIAGAPTQAHAKTLFWKDLKAMTRPFWRGAPSESELTITLNNDAVIRIVGLDRPERVEGSPVHGMVLDEFANMKPETWSEHLQPMTADFNAWVDFVGVPDYTGPNMPEYAKLIHLAQTNEDPAWGCFTWKSADILPADKIEEYRRSTSALAFAQEYEGSLVSAPGTAYYAFSVPTHVRPLDVDPKQSLHVSADFNRGFHNWVVAQIGETAGLPTFKFVDQVFLQDATVEQMCLALRDMLAAWECPDGPTLHFYGDYAGIAKTATASYPAWQQIKAHFPRAEYHYRTAGPINDRVDAVNAALRSASGDVRMHVSPKCTELIKDLQYVTRSMLFSGQKTDRLTHASDAAGYLIVQYPRAESGLTREELAKFNSAMF